MEEMKKWGYLLLVISMIVMVGSSAAAAHAHRDIDDGLSNHGTNDHQQPLLSLITNILEGAGAAVYNTLSCTPAGGDCSTSSECCPHNACRFIYNRCEWCPGAGDSCGLTWECCPGLSCSSGLSGTCS